METITKYTAIKVGSQRVDDEQMVELSFGRISGSYYSREYPETEFDTEQEAVEYAFKQNKYDNWLILPIIQFVND